MTERARRRRGFTMITVLWIMSVGSVVGLAGSLAGRTTVSAARNRVQAERALWLALGCARRVQADVDALLRDAPTLDEDVLIWRLLSRRVTPQSMAPCTVALEAAGARLDVNHATTAMLVSLLRTTGQSDEAANALAQAIVAHGPIEDIKELSIVAGFEKLSGLEAVFTADAGRVSLAHASVDVLQSVPGFTRETADLIASLAEAGTPVRDASVITSRVSKESAEALMSNYPEIVRVTTPDPDAWLLTVRVANGHPASMVELRWRLIRTGKRCVVTETRTGL